jgi:hypothetical protein
MKEDELTLKFVSQSPDPKKNKRETLNTFPNNKKKSKEDELNLKFVSQSPILKKIKGKR